MSDGSLSIVGISCIMIETGSASPCLDLSHISQSLSIACVGVDFCLIEGMGRAIHTNLNASLNCDTVKIGVFKNPYLANKCGVKLYDGLVKFEQI